MLYTWIKEMLYRCIKERGEDLKRKEAYEKAHLPIPPKLEEDIRTRERLIREASAELRGSPNGETYRR